jgi:ketosteroid isomerase-like protein
MLAKETVAHFANHWLAAWNAHDLDAIMAHYADEVTLSSPVAAQLLNHPSGQVSGKAALRQYFQKGLEAFPELRFSLIEALRGQASVVLYYQNQRGTCTAEYMELSPAGLVTRVVVNYSL